MNYHLQSRPNRMPNLHFRRCYLSWERQNGRRQNNRNLELQQDHCHKEYKSFLRNLHLFHRRFEHHRNSLQGSLYELEHYLRLDTRLELSYQRLENELQIPGPQSKKYLHLKKLSYLDQLWQKQ